MRDPILESRPSDQPVLDLAGACEFLELPMQQLMVLLPEAVREINAKMEQLRLSVPASDIPAISLNAHTIKSVAASIGAKAVRLAAECIELAATKRQPEECAELFPALELEIGRLAEAVSDLP